MTKSIHLTLLAGLAGASSTLMANNHNQRRTNMHKNLTLILSAICLAGASLLSAAEPASSPASSQIWLRELPAIPLLQWYHRIPHNETYWRGWPSEKNPYVNSAFWARTWLLVLLELDPVDQKKP
jgi:hypothetical protein